MMHARLETNLLRLSLQRVSGLRHPPPTPSNADRLRAFRAASEPDIGNGHNWQAVRESRQREAYAREQMADATPTTDSYGD